MTKNLLILVFTIAVCLVLGEVLLRFYVDEVNFLKPELTVHDELEHVIVPGSAGHDEWGFRNVEVPKTAQIVAIGDSQTYGTSAPASESWPAWIERLSGATVYNMGVGGYGPPHYRYLLNVKAEILEPDLVFIGFYFGNDLRDSYRYAYLNESTIGPLSSDRFLGNLRDWLARNSLIYQMSKSFGGGLIDLLRFYERPQASEDQTYPVITENWRTVLTPGVRFQVLDQSKDANRIGLSESLDIMRKTQEDCNKLMVRCVFVLIPTKLTVYWPTARDVLSGEGYQNVRKEVEEEAKVRSVVMAFLADHGIEFVDPTGALQAAAREAALYPGNSDGHLNPRGNRVLAAEILDHAGTSRGSAQH